MNGMNNASEPSLIIVRYDKPKTLTGLGQNGKGYRSGSGYMPDVTDDPSG